MEFEDFRERVQAERKVRAQRDAAEKNVSGERLRREIREAFARERDGEPQEDRQIGVSPDPLDPPTGRGAVNIPQPNTR